MTSADERQDSDDTEELDENFYQDIISRHWHRDRSLAHLIPDNNEAKKAFSDIVAKLKADPELSPSWRRFIHVNEAQEALAPDMELSDEESSETCLIWTGHYALSLEEEQLPETFSQHGWLLGAGRKELKDDGVDIMLTSDKPRHRISGRHARFALHENQPILLLCVENDKMVRVDGKPMQNTVRVIEDSSTRLQFGLLQYCLQYTNLTPGQLQDQLQILRHLQKLWGIAHRD